MLELTSSAKQCLESYVKEKNLRMTFTFHDEAIKHLARLSRILVILKNKLLKKSPNHTLF